VVNDPGGEPLACAARALDMPSAVFQRVLLFLKPEFGSSVNYVYRLSRLYDRLDERSALIMLAAWRGSIMAVTRAKYRPSLQRRRAPSRPPRRPPRPSRDATAWRRRRTTHGFARLSTREIEKMPPRFVLVSTIQASGSKRISLTRRSSTDASGTGSRDMAAKMRSMGRLSS